MPLLSVLVGPVNAAPALRGYEIDGQFRGSVRPKRGFKVEGYLVRGKGLCCVKMLNVLAAYQLALFSLCKRCRTFLRQVAWSKMAGLHISTRDWCRTGWTTSTEVRSETGLAVGSVLGCGLA
jgi:hypothetical protein